jgi:replicative DNA helicase
MNNVKPFDKQPRQDVTLEKLLPFSMEAERAVLGGMLLDERNVHMILAMLSPEEFYTDAHKAIFNGIERLKNIKAPIDKVSLINELRKAGTLERANGVMYITTITDGLCDAVNFEYYAKIIREKSKLRQGVAIANELMTRCYQDEDSPEEIFEDHQEALRKINRISGEGLTTGADAIHSTFTFLEERCNDKRSVTGVASGLPDLDELTTGFQKGDLIIVAAKTGFGKTAFALNVVNHAAITERRRVLIVSLEMTREQLGVRMLSIEAEVDSQQMRKGYLNKDDWSKISRAAGILSECRFWIHDKSITISQLDALARRLADENGLDLIVVDYLQLVEVQKRCENRTQEVTVISRGLKRIATDLNVPLIALSQLNAEGEVRESRAIEQDASQVIVIEMDKADLKVLNLVPASIEIRKNRNGPLGTVKTQFRKAITRFEIGTN